MRHKNWAFFAGEVEDPLQLAACGKLEASSLRSCRRILRFVCIGEYEHLRMPETGRHSRP